MNIGFDAKRALFNHSGLGNYSRSAIELVSRYYPANNYYLFAGKIKKKLIQPYANQPVIGPGNSFYSTFPALWRSWGIQHQIRQEKLDIYHGLSNELPWSIKRTGVKSVVTIHDLIFLRYPEYYPAIDRRIYNFKFRHACRVADKIIATSESTRQDIIHFFGIEPSKIEVVYQTCDPRFKLPVSGDTKKGVLAKYSLPEKFILCLGTIEKRKNALSLIKAYLNENIKTPLLIAGRATAYMDEINAYLVQNPSGGRIIFRHNIESADLPALYQSALIFAYPSIFEGFGIPILEAMYSGVPVITSTGSCFSETGGDAALYCDPYDLATMGKNLSRVLSEEETRSGMIKRGLLQSKKFDGENVAANLMKVYLNL